MKKVLTVVLTLGLAVGLAASPLFATQARLTGLGIANWMIGDDMSQIYLNPARVVKHPRTLWGELGTATGSGAAPVVDGANVTIANQWGGVTGYCPIVDNAVIGLFLNRPYAGVLGGAGVNAAGTDVAAIPNDAFGNPFTALAPQTRFDLFYGLPAGGTLLGARLTLAGDSGKRDATVASPAPGAGDGSSTSEYSSSDLNLVLGAQTGSILFMDRLDLALTLGLPSAQNTFKQTAYTAAPTAGFITVGDRSFKTTGGLNFGLTARGEIAVKGQPLFAYLNYSSNDVSNKFTSLNDGNVDGDFADIGADTNIEQERKQTMTAWTAGIAYNAKTGPQTLMIVAANVNSTITRNDALTRTKFAARTGVYEEYNSETTATTVPVNLAMEHHISKVVTARLGVTQNIFQWTNTKTKDPDYAAWNAVTNTYPLNVTTEGTAGSETLAGTGVSLGVGLNLLKSLTVDAVVRQQVLFSGTYLVSGVPETLVGQLSATYKF